MGEHDQRLNSRDLGRLFRNILESDPTVLSRNRSSKRGSQKNDFPESIGPAPLSFVRRNSVSLLENRFCRAVELPCCSCWESVQRMRWNHTFHRSHTAILDMSVPICSLLQFPSDMPGSGRGQPTKKGPTVRFFASRRTETTDVFGSQNLSRLFRPGHQKCNGDGCFGAMPVSATATDIDKHKLAPLRVPLPSSIE